MAAGDPDTPIFNDLLAEHPELPQLLQPPPRRARARRRIKPPQPHADDPFLFDED